MADNETEFGRRLKAVKAKRGYLLPHHGLLAATSQRLLEAYDQAYTALALDMKVLSVRDREFVWLAVLIATDEALATHHIPKFRDAGGTDEELTTLLRIAAFARGGAAYAFVERHWLAHLPDLSIEAAYRDALRTLAGPHLRLSLLAAAAVHAARADFVTLRHAIVMAYEAAVPERDLAEALSIMMFPGSVPHYVEAARVWLELIRTGRVTPSADFAAWAALEGQGGYDQASGKATQ